MTGAGHRSGAREGRSGSGDGRSASRERHARAREGHAGAREGHAGARGAGAAGAHGPWREDGPGPSPGSCGAHAGLGADLRGTALHLLERVREAVEPLGDSDGEAPTPGSAGACRACPVCAVLAVLRGERSELASRLAEHATGLVAVLAALLETEAGGAGSPQSGSPQSGRPQGGRPESGRSGNGHAGAGRSDGVHAATSRRPAPSRSSGRPVQRIVVHRR